MRFLKGCLVAIVAVIIFINQIHITHAAIMLGQTVPFSSLVGRILGISGGDQALADKSNLNDIDLSQIQSTAQGVAAVFPLSQLKKPEDAAAMMMPTGTPEYGQAMGVSFDDALNSLATLSKAQPTLLANLTPEQKTRFINLASMPLGISCEYCCGVGPIGINENGSSKCGCQHNPALLSVTMWLMQNTNYSDAEILREVYRWKTLFFPQKMVELATKIAGGDESVLKNLPGMVGGC